MGKKKIYIYGIHGVYNYGCEAMVRTISEQLNIIYPNSCISYISYNSESDKRALRDCNTVNIIPATQKEISNDFISRGIRYIRREFGFASLEELIHIDTNWIEECDLLVVIGGDVFDLTPSQIKRRNYWNERILVSQMVKKNGGKVLLWGISVGDFEKNLRAKKTFINYFKEDVDCAILRDKKSFSYLAKEGVTNIHLCSDPAYMLKTIQSEKEENEFEVLGINLSPLSSYLIDQTKSEKEWIDIWSDIVYQLYQKLGYKKILLIPHVVISTYPFDDDLRFLKLILENLKNRKVDVDIIENNPGFIGIKKDLVKCNMVISARMHCAINAITCGVPTIFLSYSNKSIGMCEHVYGSEKMILDIRDIISDPINAIEKIRNIDKKKMTIQKYLLKKNVELYEDAIKATEIVKKEV